MAKGAIYLGAGAKLDIWGISQYAPCDGLGPGLNGCGNSSYATSYRLGPAVDGAESAATAALRGTRRPSLLAQMMEGAEVSGTLATARWRRRGHTMPHDVLKARALGTDGVTGRECWLPSAAASKVRMRPPVYLILPGIICALGCGGAEGKPELRRRNDGMRVARAAAGAKEAGPTRRLGKTRRTCIGLDDPLGVSMSTIV
jgi:hypothetical protein